MNKQIPTCAQLDMADLVSVIKEKPGGLKDAAEALNSVPTVE